MGFYSIGDRRYRFSVIIPLLRDYSNKGLYLKKSDIQLRLTRSGIEVCDKTIQRDLKVLKEKYEAPLTCHGRNGWTLTDLNWEGPDDFDLENLAARHLVAITIATEMASPLKGIPLYDELQNLKRKIQNCYELSNDPLENITEKIQFISPPASSLSSNIWDQLANGLLMNEWMEIEYEPHGRDVRPLTVFPLRLVCLDHEWYFFCRKRTEGLVLQLPVRNIRKVQKSKCGTDFITTDFQPNVQAALDNRFGWFACDRDIETVCVVFDQAIAHQLDTRCWHKSEIRKRLGNGDIEIRFPTSAAGSEPLRFLEVRKWILSYARFIKHVSPQKLKNYVIDDLKAAQAQLSAESPFQLTGSA